MVHMVDHLNHLAISKCGHYAFEKEFLAVEDKMKRGFFIVFSPCQRNCSIIRWRGEDIVVKA